MTNLMHEGQEIVGAFDRHRVIRCRADPDVSSLGRIIRQVGPGSDLGVHQRETTKAQITDTQDVISGHRESDVGNRTPGSQRVGYTNLLTVGQ
ncbi:hypothetical protein PS925_05915 [Pseudomonas fluorescens]|uniref:Uncharacterized protein n=1 Tax=Pseudomonas fluorescens TaxID=294 RepID=A0A5E7VSR5_PSEFL|nr:hypothetical protein PS925_05915 [Pseudomonas fluorescens]